MLNCRGSVQVWRLPQLGQGTDSLMSTVSGSAMSCRPAYSSWRWSSRKRLWHDWHSTSGSVNVARWPLASQVFVGRMIAGVEADHVVARGDHGAPPLLLDVLLQLHAERAVVPGGAGAAVDLAGGEDEAAALAEGDDGVEACWGVAWPRRVLLGSAGWLSVCSGAFSLTTGSSRILRASPGSTGS